ncbi:hypothetical protein PSEUBRA_005567 [Kalmanozyma brasiliensis GHG001]|uniref:uncharacterized protein n=1 Tax=Kalmanozyma brasiliensis (strain GHG001) TaxID=1365824 RepID=UPI002867E71A|nr:uncharacterized protein PSEUBRA_005567 [Kalmanozyma brasiliensis GHG001]KAF6767530.1 hypothetical protein PSEUBRA_005567 [Kalmanozyma brasiliensis GHG001]
MTDAATTPSTATVAAERNIASLPTPKPAGQGEHSEVTTQSSSPSNKRINASVPTSAVERIRNGKKRPRTSAEGGELKLSERELLIMYRLPLALLECLVDLAYGKVPRRRMYDNLMEELVMVCGRRQIGDMLANLLTCGRDLDVVDECSEDVLDTLAEELYDRVSLPTLD